MPHLELEPSDAHELTQLFTSVFSASEGEEEGGRIGQLASELGGQIDGQEIRSFGCREGDRLIGAVFFTRLTFPDNVGVFMLAPVAVHTDFQGLGVGQSLIRFGLEEVKRSGATVSVTYGDPAFYGKVGFTQLSEDVLPAPLELSMPEGWLGQSLTGHPIPVFQDKPACVAPFQNPAFW